MVHKLYLFEELTEKWAKDTMIEISESESKEFELYINSYGGEVYTSVGFYDYIKDIAKIKLKTIVVGQCASAAIIVFLAGQEREATKNSRFMTHFCKFENNDERSDQQEIAIDEGKQINGQMLDIIIQNSNKDKAYWNREMKYKDFWFGTEKAIELGFLGKKDE